MLHAASPAAIAVSRIGIDLSSLSIDRPGAVAPGLDYTSINGMRRGWLTVVADRDGNDLLPQTDIPCRVPHSVYNNRRIAGSFSERLRNAT
jgi:hypothetical protein